MNKNNKGFTLIELALVISIGLGISFVSFQNMIKNQENKDAEIAGQQIKTIGNSVNNYITNKYDLISLLSNSSNNSNDPGPRTCYSASNSCTITLQTLINENFLPASYSSNNIFGSDYEIILKRTGTAPYYNIGGLITTKKAWIGNNGMPRFDLLGKAMQSAGIDSGMNRELAIKMTGYKGLWTFNNSEYSNITTLGQLSYIAGIGSNSYSVFLRRDGTLPMTGALNMDGNDINAAKNITANATIQGTTLKSTGDTNVGGNLTTAGTSTLTGAVTASNTITAAGKIRSNSYFEGQNGGGDGFRIGGNDANDYEFALYTAKPLTIWRSGGNSNETRLNVYGKQINTGDLILNASGDGLSNGNLTATGEIISQGKIRSESYFEGKNGGGDGFRIGGSDSNDVEFALYTANKPLTVWRNGGASNESRFNVLGSQINSGDLRVQAGGDGTTTGQITASGNITSTQTVSGQYLLATATNVVGGTCVTNGIISKDAEGVLLTCQSGVWQRQRFSSVQKVVGGVTCGATSAFAYCPAGTVLVSGGYRLAQSNGKTNGTNSPDISMPNDAATGWQVYAGGYPDYCFTAIALCAK